MSGDLGNSYNIDIWGLLIALGMVAWRPSSAN